MEKLRSALKNTPFTFNKIYERRQTMRYARLSFSFLKGVFFLFRKVKLWYTKVQKKTETNHFLKHKKEGYYSNE